MKTQKLINSANAQSLKQTAKSFGLKVKIHKPSSQIDGKNVVIEIEGYTDHFILFAQKLKALDVNPAIFSEWHVNCQGSITRLKRVLKKAKVKPSEMIAIMKSKGCSEETIKNTKKYLVKQILENGRCNLSISYPFGGNDRLKFSF